MVAVTIRNTVNHAIDAAALAAMTLCARALGILAHIYNRDLPRPTASLSEEASYEDEGRYVEGSQADGVRQLATSLKPLVTYRPGVNIDLHMADAPTVAAATLLLIEKGMNTAPALHSFLKQRGVGYDLETYEFLLGLYDGDDRYNCLWRHDAVGRYSLLN